MRLLQITLVILLFVASGTYLDAQRPRLRPEIDLGSIRSVCENVVNWCYEGFQVYGGIDPRNYCESMRSDDVFGDVYTCVAHVTSPFNSVEASACRRACGSHISALRVTEDWYSDAPFPQDTWMHCCRIPNR